PRARSEYYMGRPYQITGVVLRDGEEVARRRLAPSQAAAHSAGSTRKKPQFFAGCLLGEAVGDALGAPVEFLSLPELRAQFGLGGVHDYSSAYGKIGAITDD